MDQLELEYLKVILWGEFTIFFRCISLFDFHGLLHHDIIPLIFQCHSLQSSSRSLQFAGRSRSAGNQRQLQLLYTKERAQDYGRCCTSMEIRAPHL